MSHKFNITTAVNDQFKFDFSYNAEKIFWSENYKQKASAKSAIESLKKNAPGAPTVDLTKDETGVGYRFEIVASKNGEHFVRFVASNGEILVRTETYKQKSSALSAIGSIQRNGPEATVDDETIARLPDVPLPSQDMGAHFEVYEGVIALSSAPALGDFGNAGRLESLRPLVADCLSELLGAIEPSQGMVGNDPHFRLRRQAQQYLDAINHDVSEIDYGLLFGLGSMLQNRLEADENMSQESDLVPLSDRQRAALRDFQDQHGPFISSSTEGMRSLAAAERVERNPEQERKLASDMIEVADILEKSGGLVAPNVVTTIKDAATELGAGKQADRLTVYGSNTAKNLIIVTVAAGVTAAVALASSARPTRIFSGGHNVTRDARSYQKVGSISRIVRPHYGIYGQGKGRRFFAARE
jgi:uncharacterized protein YegP (UPF0339 family)